LLKRTLNNAASAVIRPSSVGRVPVIWLFPTLKKSTAVSRPSSVGRVPVKYALALSTDVHAAGLLKQPMLRR